MKEINVQSQKDLFTLLSELGGEVVSTGYLPLWEIQQAQESNRIWVDENGLGFVWIPTFKNPFPETVEEVQLFEHCYPLDVEKPLKIKLAKILNWKCNQPNCKEIAAMDYNGDKVCEYHYKKLNDYFDEEYR